MDTKEVEKLAEIMLDKLNFDSLDKSGLLMADGRLERLIIRANQRHQDKPHDKKVEFELAVYLRVWSEVVAKLFQTA